MKFKNTSPKDDVEVSVDTKNLKSIIIKLTIGGLIVGFVGANIFVFGQQVYAARNALKFAFQHPEVVEPLQHQYDVEYNALQDSFAKRQNLVSPLVENELPKE